MNNRLLLIVDVQNGFVVSESTEAIIPRINKLIGKWKADKQPIVFSRFINRPDSPWARFMDWKSLTQPSETDLYASLQQDYGETYDKTRYSTWSPEIAQMCQSRGIQEVVLCGIDTDQCVLATAINVFEAGLRPVVVTDCCATSAEVRFHDAGIMLLERLVGKDQLMTSSGLLSK